MDFEGLKSYVFEMLERELPEDLIYHDIAHTRDMVVPAAERLCDLEGVEEENKVLVLSAAVLHDIGYVKRYEDNEVIAVEMAKNILAKFNYDDEKISRVCDMILATKMPQNPEGLLSQILCDADLSNLGDEDFVGHGNKLRREFCCKGIEYSDESWFNLQVDFLKNHKYFTQSARKMWNERKAKNLIFFEKKTLKLKPNF